MPPLNVNLGTFIAQHHHTDLLRVQTLTHYEVASDDEDYHRYLDGAATPTAAGKGEWLDRLRTDTAAGRLRRNVHIVRTPLTPYLRYQFEWCYLSNTSAGQDIRVLDAAEITAAAALLPVGDLAIVEGRYVAQLRYSPSGEYQGAVAIGADAASGYVALAQVAWELATPFTTWWAAHPQYHRDNTAAGLVADSNKETMGGRSGGRDELSRTLRELRQAAHLSTRDAAGRTGFSAAKISRVERGINVPTEADVAVLVAAYQTPEDVRIHLRDIARDIRAEYRPVVMARGKGRPSAFQERLTRIEATTEHLTTFTPTVVPGLLQTETYMRALVAYRELPPAEVDKFVAARLARQERLNDPAHRCTQITTEGALGWRAGSPADMAEQVDRIIAATWLPTVRVGIVAWGTQAPVFPLHGWDLHDQRAVIYGTADATAVLTEPGDVARYVMLTAAVERIAVWDDEARAVLTRISDQYRAT
jgi:transcriptional regulator with XRE-family HTH domain